jgi:hypothetical protein
VRTACVLTVLCSGCSSAPVKEPAPAPAPVAAFDGVDVTVLRPDPWAGFQPATMKIDPRELTGEYSLSAGVPGSIELRLLDRGVFFESFAGCIPCVKYTFGTWQLVGEPSRATGGNCWRGGRCGIGSSARPESSTGREPRPRPAVSNAHAPRSFRRRGRSASISSTRPTRSAKPRSSTAGPHAQVRAVARHPRFPGDPPAPLRRRERLARRDSGKHGGAAPSRMNSPIS